MKLPSNVKKTLIKPLPLFISLIFSVGNAHAYSVNPEIIPGNTVNTPKTPLPAYEYHNSLGTIIQDGGFRAYWCADTPMDAVGSVIAYSTAPSLAGPWSKPKQVFAHDKAPSGSGIDVDSLTHTCDPSVLRVKNKYYLYYSIDLSIGVASSNDGINWVKENKGYPIIISKYDPTKEKPPYTNALTWAQSPSTVYLNDYIYMSYATSTYNTKDDTAAGTKLIRSKDPLFLKNVEILTAAGWVPRTFENSSASVSSLMPNYQTKLAYSDILNQFITTYKSDYFNNPGLQAIEFRDPISFKVIKEIKSTTSDDGYWVNNTSLLRKPDGHLPVNQANSRLLPIGLISNGMNPEFTGYNITASLTMLDTRLDKNKLFNSLAGAYNGYRLETPGLPTAVVVNKQRVQFELNAPAKLLAKQVLMPSGDDFNAIPYLTNVYKGQKVIQAPGKPGAFVVKNKLNKDILLPISCYGLVKANQSTIEQVSVEVFNKYPVGPNLYCIS